MTDFKAFRGKVDRIVSDFGQYDEVEIARQTLVLHAIQSLALLDIAEQLRQGIKTYPHGLTDIAKQLSQGIVTNPTTTVKDVMSPPSEERRTDPSYEQRNKAPIYDPHSHNT